MASLWIALGAALILTSALDASLAKSTKLGVNDTTSGGRCIGCIIKGIEDILGPPPPPPPHCPPCDKRSCPQIDITEIINNIKNVRTDVNSIKQIISKVENINNVVVSVRKEVDAKSRETNIQIQQILNEIKKGGGCSSGISKLTNIINEVKLTLNEFIKTSTKVDSTITEKYKSALQTEKENTEILKKILSIVTSSGGNCKGIISEIDNSVQKIINKLTAVVRKSTDEVVVIVGRRGGEVKQSVTVLIESLRKEIIQMTKKFVEKIEIIVEDSERHMKEIETITQTITTTTKTVAEDAAHTALTVFQGNLKGSRSLCD